MNIKQLEIKNIDVYSMLSSGFLYLGLGILFLTQKGVIQFAVKNLLNLLVTLFIIAAFFQIIGFTPLKKKRLTSISKLVGFTINVGVAGVLHFKPEIIVGVLPVFFGGYAIFSGIIRFLIYLQYRANDVSRRFLVILSAVVLFVLGIAIIIHPLASILPISNVIGIFFTIYGVSFLIDAFIDILPKNTKDSFKRRTRISLPVFMVALIPHRVLMKINKVFETDDFNESNLAIFKENTSYDLEILIHVADKGVGVFGHVDIWFDNKLMTYGSYDDETYRLKGIISDGVFIEIDDKEKYIQFSQKHMKKTLFGFGLKLTEEQKERVKEKIKDIHQDLYRWKSKAEVDRDEGIYLSNPREDYASILYYNLKGKFYKFKRGPFKTYFAMNTNCVLLADKIVGQAGIDIVKIQGLISPGAYFEFFNREFSKKDSIVISRTIYYKDSTMFTKREFDKG